MKYSIALQLHSVNFYESFVLPNGGKSDTEMFLKQKLVFQLKLKQDSQKILQKSVIYLFVNFENVFPNNSYR